MTVEPPERRAPLVVDAWRLAVGTLTAIPVSPPSRIDRQVAGLAMTLAPVAALPVALPWLVVGAVAAVLPSAILVFAVVAVIAATLITRAMHLDGLADTADGLSASYDRERALEIMKTGDVGPSGAAAIALTLLLQVAGAWALFLGASVLPAAAAILCALAICTSRASLTLACRSGIPAARPGGLGATVAGSVRTPVALAVPCILAAAGAGALVAVGAPWWPAPVVVAVGAITAGLVVRHCVRRLGGITGDVLGAAVETSCGAAVAAAAVAVTLIPF